MASAGPVAFPLRFFVGPSTVTRLLRTFLPLALALILVEILLDVSLPSVNNTHNALLVLVTLVVFSLFTGGMVIRAARGLGGLWKPRSGDGRQLKRNLPGRTHTSSL